MDKDSLDEGTPWLEISFKGSGEVHGQILGALLQERAKYLKSQAAA